MDAAVLQWTDADRRRMRMGELTAATRNASRRVRRFEGAEESDTEETPVVESPVAGEETDEQQRTRVAREKAQWRNEENRRRQFESVMNERLSETRKLAVQYGIPELTAQYQAQREMRRVEAERSETVVDVQTQLSASSNQIQSMLSQARDGNVPWEYRRSVLSRARLAVSDHLAALHQIQDRYYDKFAEFAGKPDLIAEVSAKATEIEQRKRLMDEYYDVLHRMAGGDQMAGAQLDHISGEASQVAPDMVRNSSNMRLLARRRRNFWAEVA